MLVGSAAASVPFAARAAGETANHRVLGLADAVRPERVDRRFFGAHG